MKGLSRSSEKYHCPLPFLHKEEGLTGMRLPSLQKVKGVLRHFSLMLLYNICPLMLQANQALHKGQKLPKKVTWSQCSLQAMMNLLQPMVRDSEFSSLIRNCCVFWKEVQQSTYLLLVGLALQYQCAHTHRRAQVHMHVDLCNYILKLKHRG